MDTTEPVLGGTVAVVEATSTPFSKRATRTWLLGGSRVSRGPLTGMRYVPKPPGPGKTTAVSARSWPPWNTRMAIVAGSAPPGGATTWPLTSTWLTAPAVATSSVVVLWAPPRVTVVEANGRLSAEFTKTGHGFAQLRLVKT